MRTLLLLSLVVSSVCSARAQTVIINPPAPIRSVPAQHQRVTVSVTLSTPAAATSAGDATSGLTAANTQLYAIVNHQCDVLGPLLNGDCRSIGIATNGNINERPVYGSAPATTPVVNVTANATFELDPKPSASLPAH